AETEHDEAAERSPEQSAPRKAFAARADRFNRRGQCGGVWLRCDADAAMRRASALTGLREGDARIVEPERGGFARVAALAHCSLSPIRNCSARSRRMWGSAGSPCA